MEMKKEKVNSHNYKIDLVIVILLLSMGIGAYMLARQNDSYTESPSDANNTTVAAVNSTAEVTATIPQAKSARIDESSSQYTELYHVFWQRFNTFAALSADYNADSVVSSTEVDLFKTELLKRYELHLSGDNDLFVVNKFGQIIPPGQMLCYLNNFKINEETQNDAFKACSELTPSTP